jgi:hypothetical protein
VNHQDQHTTWWRRLAGVTPRYGHEPPATPSTCLQESEKGGQVPGLKQPSKWLFACGLKGQAKTAFRWGQGWLGEGGKAGGARGRGAGAVTQAGGKPPTAGGYHGNNPHTLHTTSSSRSKGKTADTGDQAEGIQAGALQPAGRPPPHTIQALKLQR